jgi:organic hydroperoxide reductase OsmC/OhrA
MIQYPINFTAETFAKSGMQSNWKTQSQFEATSVSIPPEFMGPGGGLSPEDLFNHALVNCFVATFKVYAENSRLTFDDITVNSNLVVDLDDQKRPVMKDFFLKATIKNPSSVGKAMLLAKKASESGFILNSVKTNCHFDFMIA